MAFVSNPTVSQFPRKMTRFAFQAFSRVILHQRPNNPDYEQSTGYSLVQHRETEAQYKSSCPHGFGKVRKCLQDRKPQTR